MIQFVSQRWSQIMLNSWQHLSLVVQCLVLATVIALVVAAVCYRSTFLTSVANNVSAVGLTIPSFALIGLLIIPLGFGVAPAVAVVTFFAVLPILRNAVVGLTEVDPALVEAARGVGMSRVATFFRVELPLAWPVVIAGMRISAQMTMGIAAVAAYALGPRPWRLHFLWPLPPRRSQFLRVSSHRCHCRCHPGSSSRRGLDCYGSPDYLKGYPCLTQLFPKQQTTQ